MDIVSFVGLRWLFGHRGRRLFGVPFNNIRDRNSRILLTIIWPRRVIFLRALGDIFRFQRVLNLLLILLAFLRIRSFRAYRPLRLRGLAVFWVVVNRRGLVHNIGRRVVLFLVLVDHAVHVQRQLVERVSEWLEETVVPLYCFVFRVFLIEQLLLWILLFWIGLWRLFVFVRTIAVGFLLVDRRILSQEAEIRLILEFHIVMDL